MNRSILLTLCLVAVAAIGQAPMPTPVSFAWERPLPTNGVTNVKLEWSGGFDLFPVDVTNATVENFPLGFANKVSAYSVSSSGLTSDTNTIYVLNVRAIFEESNDPNGPWVEGPEAHVLVERKSPLGFFRVRLEIQ